jgi:hypothetical protein
LTWVTKVTLRVDHSWKEVQTSPMDEQLVFNWLEGLTERNGFDAPVSNAEITDSGRIREHHRCAVNEQVAGHVGVLQVEVVGVGSST